LFKNFPDRSPFHEDDDKFACRVTYEYEQQPTELIVNCSTNSRSGSNEVTCQASQCHLSLANGHLGLYRAIAGA